MRTAVLLLKIGCIFVFLHVCFHVLCAPVCVFCTLFDHGSSDWSISPDHQVSSCPPNDTPGALMARPAPIMQTNGGWLAAGLDRDPTGPPAEMDSDTRAMLACSPRRGGRRRVGVPRGPVCDGVAGGPARVATFPVDTAPIAPGNANLPWPALNAVPSEAEYTDEGADGGRAEHCRPATGDTQISINLEEDVADATCGVALISDLHPAAQHTEAIEGPELICDPPPSTLQPHSRTTSASAASSLAPLASSAMPQDAMEGQRRLLSVCGYAAAFTCPSPLSQAVSLKPADAMEGATGATQITIDSGEDVDVMEAYAVDGVGAQGFDDGAEHCRLATGAEQMMIGLADGVGPREAGHCDGADSSKTPQGLVKPACGEPAAGATGTEQMMIGLEDAGGPREAGHCDGAGSSKSPLGHVEPACGEPTAAQRREAKRGDDIMLECPSENLSVTGQGLARRGRKQKTIAPVLPDAAAPTGTSAEPKPKAVKVQHQASRLIYLVSAAPWPSKTFSYRRFGGQEGAENEANEHAAALRRRAGLDNESTV